VKANDAHVGGIVGFTGGTVNIANCWFAGSVTGAKQYVGGIAGRLNNGTVTIQDCLMTGTLSANHTGATMIAGGIVGGDYNTNWTLTRCLVTGTINGRTTTGIATLFGYPGAAGYTRTIADSYAKTDSVSTNALVSGTTSIISVSESCKTVDTPSKTTTPNLFRGIPWTTMEDGTPVLQLLNENIKRLALLHKAGYTHGGAHPRNFLWIKNDDQIESIWLDLATVRKMNKINWKYLLTDLSDFTEYFHLTQEELDNLIQEYRSVFDIPVAYKLRTDSNRKFSCAVKL
jgi:hypothetical protein